MNDEVKLTGALIVRADRIYLASALAGIEPWSQHTRLYHFDAQTRQPWSFHDVGFWTTALEKFRLDPDGPWTLCALSERGEIELASCGKAVMETIADAGLYRPGSAGYGYLSNLREIDGHLHACGVAGQVYKRLGPDRWVHMDDGLLQPVEVEDCLLLNAIDGNAEDDLYVAGSLPGASGYEGCLFHWDGARWRRLDLPRVGGLNVIFIENQRLIWVAGQKGALLVGNHRDGFNQRLRGGIPHLFLDLTIYRQAIYLGSNRGLFRYNEERGRIDQVDTGLAPEPPYVSTVQDVDGVLWAIGPDTVARYDGETWTSLWPSRNSSIVD